MTKQRQKDKRKHGKKATVSKNNKKYFQKQSNKKGNEKKYGNVTKFRVCAKDEPVYEKFFDLDEMRTYLCSLTEKHPKRISVRCIGESALGRPILMTLISDDDDDDDDDDDKSETQKSIIMVEAGSNGSDFYAVSSALCLIDHLIKHPNLTKLVDYIVIPCSNPDGYLYCLNNEDNGTVPIDLTHNFPLSHLGWCDLSTIQTGEFLHKIGIWKENYKFNAPETRTLHNVISSYQLAIKLLISLQEGGERILIPFGCCDTKLEDEYKLLKIATSGAAGFKEKCMSIGSIYNCCGLTYGTLIDFLKFEQSAIKFMYIVYLHKKGSHRVCSDKIKEYGESVTNCIKNMSKTVFMLSKRSKSDSKICS